MPDYFQSEVVATGLSLPTSLAFLPDGRTFVVEQYTGDLKLVVNDSVSTALYTVPDLNIAGNERGLLGVAVSPGWPAQPHLYLYFSRTPGDACYLIRLTATGDLSDGQSFNLAVGSRYDILTDLPDFHGRHQGGGLRFGTDGSLFVSVGDDNDFCAAQDSSSFVGCILRLDVAALPDTGTGPPSKALITPPDNPFPGPDPNVRLTFAYGLRNPFRFAIDPQTGLLYVGDVGQDSMEEISECAGGENMGWPFREGTLPVSAVGCTEPGGMGAQTYHPPIMVYPHPSGTNVVLVAGVVYRRAGLGGDVFPEFYDGVLFYADYYMGFMRGLKKIDGVWQQITHLPGQPNATDWGTGMGLVPEFKVGGDGSIYYLHQIDGTLNRIRFTGSGILDAGPPSARPLLAVSPSPAPRGGPIELTFSIASAGEVRIDLFDIRGRRVRSPFSGRLAAGDHRVRWQDMGPSLAAGVYFLRADGPGLGTSRRLVVIP